MRDGSGNYLGNPKLKAAGVQIEFTQHMINEIEKCVQDPFYFIENYVKIITKDDGIDQFKLRGYQRRILDACHNNRYVVTMLARQSGKTTTFVAYLLWYVLFHPQKSCAIMAHKGDVAKEILHNLKITYEELPRWMQQGIVAWNKHSIELENGSRITSHATSQGGPRGFAYNLILMDEVAHIPPSVFENFYASVFPTISSGKTTKLFMVSTPNGINHFYHTWHKAVKKESEYVPVTASYREVPGRDEEWERKEKALLGERKFTQEYECRFIGSQNTLIDPLILESLEPKVPIANYDFDVLPTIEQSINYQIFHQPEKDHVYVVTADVSEGIGLDYSTFNVTDITSKPYIQCARFRSNITYPEDFASKLYTETVRYNNAYLLVENNSIGAMVVNILESDYQYENMIHTHRNMKKGGNYADGLRGRPSDVAGIRTTSSTKKQGCTTLKNLIERREYVIGDSMTIIELSTFSSVNNDGKYQAEGTNATDDIVMSLVIFAWLTLQPVFSQLTEDTNIIKKMNDHRQRLIEESSLPIPASTSSFIRRPEDNRIEEWVDWGISNSISKTRNTSGSKSWY